jgi:hypothetical protein
VQCHPYSYILLNICGSREEKQSELFLLSAPTLHLRRRHRHLRRGCWGRRRYKEGPLVRMGKQLGVAPVREEHCRRGGNQWRRGASNTPWSDDRSWWRSGSQGFRAEEALQGVILIVESINYWSFIYWPSSILRTSVEIVNLITHHKEDDIRRKGMCNVLKSPLDWRHLNIKQIWHEWCSHLFHIGLCCS